MTMPISGGLDNFNGELVTMGFRTSRNLGIHPRRSYQERRNKRAPFPINQLFPRHNHPRPLEVRPYENRPLEVRLRKSSIEVLISRAVELLKSRQYKHLPQTCSSRQLARNKNTSFSKLIQHNDRLSQSISKVSISWSFKHCNLGYDTIPRHCRVQYRKEQRPLAQGSDNM
jgi:hypothetical protein